MSSTMTSPGFVSFGSMPYDDVYLEDGSSEDEDEHVISDTKKPLMSPRKRPKVALRQPQSAVGVYPLIKKRFLKWFYFVVTALFLSLMVFVLMRIAHDAMLQEAEDSKPDNDKPHLKKPPLNSEHNFVEENVIPCSDFDVQDVWVQNFPKLITETAHRLVDVNADGVLDVILGFSTGVTSYFGDQYLICDIYFNGTRPCFGGMIALDGVTGTELWRQYTNSEIYAVNCNVDIDKDGVKDCLGGGRSGVFELLSGATGQVIWVFQSKELLVSISNFYTAQFIRDVDEDGIEDVLNIHGGDPLRKPGEEATHFGLLVIISGATGHVITSMEVPDKRESYYSPQIYYQHGGREMVLFGSGGETHGGSLWVIAMTDLLLGDNSKASAIYTDDYKGIMTPPVLADITGDGVVDIVMAMFNSTTVAIDGQNYKQLWNYTMNESETYSTPGAAYYNDDDIPDFMITYSHGPGYPVYYHAQVTILDGRTGKPILTPPLQTAGSSQVSPLTVSMEGYGNDLFIYFVLDCVGHEGESKEFAFSKEDGDKSINLKSRSDFCKQRFNTKSFSRLSLLSQHMEPPGQQIYNSLDRVADEYKYTVNSSLLAEEYLASHPQVLEEVRELIINNPEGHDHHQGRGDQDADGRVHSQSRGGMDLDEVQKGPPENLDEDEDLDPLSDLQENPDINNLVPRLGFDDEEEIPFFYPPVDSQPVDKHHQPSQLDPNPQDVDPQNSYPQKKYPQDVDPLAAYPQQKYPQDVDPLATYPQQKYPQDVDPLATYPQQKYPQDMDPLATYPQQKYPQDVDPLATYPQQKYPQDVDPLAAYPQQKYPQDVDPLATYPQQKYPQDVDPLATYPQQKYPQDVDPLATYPQQKYPQDMDPLATYPQQKYPQDVDPLTTYPQKKYPQNHQPPSQPLGSDPLDVMPVPGDEDESDSGVSTQLLDELLNELLLDQQRDKMHGYPSKSDLPQSKPVDWSNPKRIENPRKKSHFDEWYDTHGDTDRGEPYNTYSDKQGSRYSETPYGRYDDTNRDDTKQWLDRAYGSSRDKFSDQSNKYFRRKRDIGSALKTKKQQGVSEDQIQQNSPSKHQSIPTKHNKRLLERDDQTKIHFSKKKDTIETKEQDQNQESLRESLEKPHISVKPQRHSSTKPQSIPIEYIVNELFLKLESRQPGISALIKKWLKDRSASEQTNQNKAYRRDDGPTNRRQRYKRHAGPHDAGGLQRLISTGTLAPVLLGQEKSSNHSIDLIFAVYWFYPADTHIILPKQQQCIDGWMTKEDQRLNPKNVFYGLDHDAYGHMALDKCTEGSTRQQRQELLYNKRPLDIYPFNIHTGELTVYRLRLTCRCGNLSKTERCAKVLPYDKQQWGGYMGTYGNSHFPPRN